MTRCFRVVDLRVSIFIFIFILLSFLVFNITCITGLLVVLYLYLQSMYTHRHACAEGVYMTPDSYVVRGRCVLWAATVM